MARNNYIVYRACDDTGMVDSNGEYRTNPAPCIVCGAPTHRWDLVENGPVCDDYSELSCADTVWAEYTKGTSSAR